MSFLTVEEKQSAGNDRLAIITSFFCCCLGHFQAATITMNNQKNPRNIPNKRKYLHICIVGWQQKIQELTCPTHSSTIFIIQRMWLVNREKEEQLSSCFKNKYICDWKLLSAISYCIVIHHGSSQYFLFPSASTYPLTKIPAWGNALAFISRVERWHNRCINLCCAFCFEEKLSGKHTCLLHAYSKLSRCIMMSCLDLSPELNYSHQHTPCQEQDMKLSLAQSSCFSCGHDFVSFAEIFPSKNILLMLLM